MQYIVHMWNVWGRVHSVLSRPFSLSSAMRDFWTSAVESNTLSRPGTKMAGTWLAGFQVYEEMAAGAFGCHDQINYPIGPMESYLCNVANILLVLS